MLSLPQYDHRGSLDFRRDAYERSYVVLALLSEIGRVETRHLTRRGAARLDLTSTRTMRRCPWRLAMGRLLRFNVLRMDASRSMLCLIRRDGPRYEPSSREDARRPLH